MNHPKKSVIALLAITLLAGCASSMNPIGEAKFDCNRKQDAKSQYCRSFKAVEASTAGEVPASRFDKEFKLSDLDRLTGISPDDARPASTGAAVNFPKSATAAIPISAPPTQRALLPHQVVNAETVLDGLPVREGPVVQRIWIKRFVDGRDVLTENTVVYREIKGTRWSGFDEPVGGTAQRPTDYPHKATNTVPSSATVTGGGQKAFTENRPTPLSTNPASEFKQPGVSTEPLEPAPVPAASGTSTMPQ